MSDMALASTRHLHRLYLDHSGWLQAWLRRRLGSEWDAADLSQEAFLRLLRNPEVLGELQEPRAYLVTIGKRLLINFQRRKSLEQASGNAIRASR